MNKLTRIGGQLVGSVGSVSPALSGSLVRANGALKGELNCGPTLGGLVFRTDSQLMGAMSLIGTVENPFYLRVSPEVVWLTSLNDFSGEFEVFSNVEWQIYGAKPDYSTYRGVYIQTSDNELYSAEEWDKTKEANGVAVITDDVKFVIALEDAYSKYCVWGDRKNVPGVTNATNNAGAKQDFDGEEQTTAIIENTTSSPAAKYCRDYIFPNGVVGYLGAAGEWNIAMEYSQEVAKALSVCGGSAMSSAYWTSTEVDGTQRAFSAMWSSAALSNYNKSASSTMRVRAFGKFIL